jgi:hypothetical protein
MIARFLIGARFNNNWAGRLVRVSESNERHRMV